MAGNTTANTPAAIRAQVYSQYILKVIEDEVLTDTFSRNVSDFGDGSTLFIPTIGETVIRDFVEEGTVQYDPVDTGQVTLTINNFKVGGNSISGKYKDDTYLKGVLEAEVPRQHARQIKEAYLADVFAQSENQTQADPNTLAGVDHRWVAYNGTTAGILSFEDFIYAKWAYDKMGVPQEGRVFICDPSAEASLNFLAGGSGNAFTTNPSWNDIIGEGFAKNNRFRFNILGFDTYVSNYLPKVASETIDGGPNGSQALAVQGVVNQFHCLADDGVKAFMSAWRRMPSTEGERNISRDRDEYTTFARWGAGLQRPDTLLSVITKAAAYK